MVLRRNSGNMNGSSKLAARPLHERKASSPMAPAFMTSAPGKVIVFGEHAVVHGKAAMAAAVSLRSYLLVTALSKSHRSVNLVFPDVSLDHTWNIDDLPWEVFAKATKKPRYYDLVTSLDEDLLKAMQPHIDNVSNHLTGDNKRIHQAAASSFLYLYLCLSNRQSAACIYTIDLPWEVFAKATKKPRYYDLVTSLDEDLLKAMQPHIDNVSNHLTGDNKRIHQAAASSFLYLYLCLSNRQSAACIYTLRSTLPIAAGLGSSASICVCISAALLKQIHVLSGPHQDQPEEEVELQLERINRWAFVGELCIHGNPSGVDNTVSTRGKAVLFKRVDYTKPPRVTPLKDFPELPLLLINTKQPRSTATEVAKVGAMKKKHPEVTEATLNSIESVTMSAHKLITSKNFDPEAEGNLQHLGDMFRVNHGLLVSLGVSHPKLEHIRELVDYAGIGWTKLTGAGGGGCAITLLKPDADPEVVRHLQQQFEDAGFEEYKTTLGGDGVGILYPAVLHNGTDEKGGEEIDHQKFLNAEGAEGIEALVGVGVLEKRKEWKFWS